MTSSRVALWLWYRGDGFEGYQAQPGGETVQGAVTAVLRERGVERSPAPSGRTDKGVHARMQVVSFRAPEELRLGELSDALGGALPGRLGCVAAVRTLPSFHAQWSATGKEYRYRLALEGPAPEPLVPFAWEPRPHPRLVGRDLCPDALGHALAAAVGERDFGAFHESSSVRKVRRLDRASLHRLDSGLYEARLVGSGFGRYQVRYLVGTALAVAAGVLEERAWQAALDGATPLPGLKAPACGLVLWRVHYPAPADPFRACTVDPGSLPEWAREDAAGTPEVP